MNRKIPQNMIKLSPDMAIVKRIADTRRIGLGARLSGFVQRIIGKYSRIQEPRPITVLYLRHLDAGDTILNSYHTHIAPRLNFTTLHWQPRSMDSAELLSPAPGIKRPVEPSAGAEKPELIYSIEPNLRLRTHDTANLFKPTSIYGIEPNLRLRTQNMAILFKPTSIYGIEPNLRLRTQNMAILFKPASIYDSGHTAPIQIGRPPSPRPDINDIPHETQHFSLRQDNYDRMLKETQQIIESTYLPVRKIVHRTNASVPDHSDNTYSRPIQDFQTKQKEAPKMQPSMPSLDVNRLTEQVIREIDRRIASQRERMGR